MSQLTIGSAMPSKAAKAAAHLKTHNRTASASSTGKVATAFNRTKSVERIKRNASDVSTYVLHPFFHYFLLSFGPFLVTATFTKWLPIPAYTATALAHEERGSFGGGDESWGGDGR